MLDAETLFLVDDDQAQILEGNGTGEGVPMTRSTPPEAKPALTFSASLGVEKRESVPMVTGNPA